VAAIESFSVSRSAGALMREWSLARAKVSRHLIQDTIPESTCRPCCRYAVSCMQDFRLSPASMTTIWMHSSTCGLAHIYIYIYARDYASKLSSIRIGPYGLPPSNGRTLLLHAFSSKITANLAFLPYFRASCTSQYM
jgi:hypothetical protein